MTNEKLIRVCKLRFYIYEKMINPWRFNWTKIGSRYLHRVSERNQENQNVATVFTPGE